MLSSLRGRGARHAHCFGRSPRSRRSFRRQQPMCAAAHSIQPPIGHPNAVKKSLPPLVSAPPYLPTLTAFVSCLCVRQPCVLKLETLRDEVAHLSPHSRHEALRPLCEAAPANAGIPLLPPKPAAPTTAGIPLLPSKPKHNGSAHATFPAPISLLEIQEEQAEWEAPAIHGTPPAPRGGHCAHLQRETLYIFGGCSVGTRARCYNDVHALDTRSLTWSSVPAAGTPPHPASRIACASAGAALAVFGGYAGTYSNAVHLLDAERRTWTRAQPAGTAPHARAGASFTRSANSLILFGGADDVMAYNDVHVLSANGEAWHAPPARCAPAPCALPVPREGHSASLVGTKLWIYGGVGRVGRAYTALTHLAYLDVTTWTWHDPALQMQATDLAPTARSLHASLTLGSRLLLLGGITTPKRTPLPDGAILDGETFGWSRPLPIGHPPPARHGASLTLRGRTVYAFGGCGEAACTDEIRTLAFKYQRRQTYEPFSVSADGTRGSTLALAGAPLNSLHSGCPSNCTQHGKCWMRRCLCSPGWEGHDCSVAEPCECNNRGFCGHGRCFCDPGFDGPHCEIVARCPSNCSEHGQCLHGRCVCSPGYAGPDCSELVQCPGEGGPCSLRGICVNGLCFCKEGASGDGCEKTLPCPGAPDNACTGHGVCWESKCFCAPGWTGLGCEEQLECPNDCRDEDGVKRGKCHYGRCSCDAGFTGANCSTVASCENDCNHNGVCYLDRCECEPGYGGSDCSLTLFECTNNCTGHGACRLGQCLCHPNWQGSDCSKPLHCPRDCTGHGICFDGNCLCEEGYGGVDCAVALPACPNECNHRGLCVHGVCSCAAEWSGYDCSEERKCPADCHGNGLCSFGRCYCGPGYDGPDCATPTGCEGPHHCAGRGVCDHGRCFCDPGYFGKNCTLAIECPHDCGSEEQGVCANGRCFCHTGWEGPDCTTPARCPSDADGIECSENGKCERGQCVCEPGYTGDACEREVPCPNGCRSQGDCWGGRCLCFPGFYGDDCSIIESCPEECNSHGVCRHGMCYCDAGFEGSACELVVPCPAHCSNRGVCQHGQCFCDPGYGGRDCADELRCPVSNGRVCSSRGLCVDGSCVCVSGVGGAACEEVYSSSAVQGLDLPRSTAASPPAPVKGGLVEYRTLPVARAARRNLVAHATALIETASELLPSDISPTEDESKRNQSWAAEEESDAAGSPRGRMREPPVLLETASATVLLQTSSAKPLVEPALRSRDPAEEALGLRPSVVWPSAAIAKGAVTLRPDASKASALPYGADAGPTLDAPEPPAVCLGGCDGHGTCFNGRCFCDPGWEGADCAREQQCPVGCAQHGVCAYGACYCDPGFEGPACDTVLACPGECSGHGTCANARCYCEAGWRGVDCGIAAPKVESEIIGLWACIGVASLVVGLGMSIGWGVRYALHERKRAKMREILQQDAQRPFMSHASVTG